MVSHPDNTAMKTTATPASGKETSGRYIGIQHRCKRTADGEPRPSKVAIHHFDENRMVHHMAPVIELESEQHELDFLHHKFATRWKELDTACFSENDLPLPPPHQWKHRKIGLEEQPENFSPHLVFRLHGEKQQRLITHLPDQWEGVQQHDIILLPLGGSGDYLAYAAAVQAGRVGAAVFRCRPSALKEFRETLGDTDTTNDATRIIEFYKASPDMFYPVEVKDLDMIYVREFFRARQTLQRDRKSCNLRLLQQNIGRIFVTPEGLYPQGGVEKNFDEIQAKDAVFQALMSREKELDKEIAKALKAIPAYTKLFEPITGVGPIIAAGILTAVGDVRLFVRPGGNLAYRAGKLKQFCGVACRPDGSFARKRVGQTLGYNPGVRQALYLLGDQFNRRPDSVWGKVLKEEKARLREKHPQLLETADSTKYVLVDGQYEKKGTKYIIQQAEGGPVTVTGKLRYTPGHIQKMALWHTLRRFVEWLYEEWTKLEGVKVGSGPTPTAPVPTDEIWNPGSNAGDGTAANAAEGQVVPIAA
jgi:hypothetical protein